MQTRRVGWVVRNKYLGDNHQNNNGRNKCRQRNSADTLQHYPDSNTTTGLNLRTQMQALKDMQATTHAKNPEYLIYGQNHYNAVWYNTKLKTKGNSKRKRKKERN
jgi:hypothetical protein